MQNCVDPQVSAPLLVNVDEVMGAKRFGRSGSRSSFKNVVDILLLWSPQVYERVSYLDLSIRDTVIDLNLILSDLLLGRSNTGRMSSDCSSKAEY